MLQGTQVMYCVILFWRVMHLITSDLRTLFPEVFLNLCVNVRKGISVKVFILAQTTEIRKHHLTLRKRIFFNTLPEQLYGELTPDVFINTV